MFSGTGDLKLGSMAMLRSFSPGTATPLAKANANPAATAAAVVGDGVEPVLSTGTSGAQLLEVGSWETASNFEITAAINRLSDQMAATGDEQQQHNTLINSFTVKYLGMVRVCGSSNDEVKAACEAAAQNPGVLSGGKCSLVVTADEISLNPMSTLKQRHKQLLPTILADVCPRISMDDVIACEFCDGRVGIVISSRDGTSSSGYYCTVYQVDKHRGWTLQQLVGSMIVPRPVPRASAWIDETLSIGRPSPNTTVGSPQQSSSITETPSPVAPGKSSLMPTFLDPLLFAEAGGYSGDTSLEIGFEDDSFLDLDALLTAWGPGTPAAKARLPEPSWNSLHAETEVEGVDSVVDGVSLISPTKSRGGTNETTTDDQSRHPHHSVRRSATVWNIPKETYSQGAQIAQIENNELMLITPTPRTESGMITSPIPPTAATAAASHLLGGGGYQPSTPRTTPKRRELYRSGGGGAMPTSALRNCQYNNDGESSQMQTPQFGVPLTPNTPQTVKRQEIMEKKMKREQEELALTHTASRLAHRRRMTTDMIVDDETQEFVMASSLRRTSVDLSARENRVHDRTGVKQLRFALDTGRSDSERLV
jgi:hypothetical protein